MYGYAFSLFLIALGAILRFAVTATVSGFKIETAGVILMLIGFAGIIFTFGARLLDHDEIIKVKDDK